MSDNYERYIAERKQEIENPILQEITKCFGELHNVAPKLGKRNFETMERLLRSVRKEAIKLIEEK